jgi:hypothetical protein
MRQTAVLLSVLSCLALSATAFAADSQLMNLVMPDAKILAGVNVTSAENSPLGRFILLKVGVIPQDFVNATGFNPLQDVTEILAATAADPSNLTGLVLARGTFPVDKIAAKLAAKTGSWQVATYGGATLFNTTNPNGKTVLAVAFLGDSIAIAGDVASVTAAIDRSTGSNSIDPALTVTVNQLSATEDEWLASTASVGSLLPASAGTAAPAPANPLATVLPLLKNIQSFNGGIKFGDVVALTGEVVTTSPQNAAALNAVFKLGVMLAGSAGGANTAGNQLASAMQFLQALQITTNGSAVDLSLSIPEAQIEALVNSVPAKTPAASVHPAVVRIP